MSVPIIDISEWNRSTSGDNEIAGEVDAACRTVGFFKIEGHGVDDVLVDQIYEETTKFFSLPSQVKLDYATPPEIDRGYTSLGGEGLSYSIGLDSPPDLFEAFNIGVAEILGVDESDSVLWAPNVWPDTPPGFQSTLLRYAATMYELADRMLGIFAVALGLDEHWLQQRADRSPDVLRALNYERRPGSPAPIDGQMRLGAHSDFGTCTILLADPVPGLQILGLDGAWHDVVPTPGTFLINIGDLLAAWTNDRWRSTLHRVVPPSPDTRGAAQRRSFAYFHEANPEVIIEPLPTCVTTASQPQYEPFSVGDHLTGKLVGPRTFSSSTATSTVGDRAAQLSNAAASPVTEHHQ